jgi:hypothetical protein
MARPAPALHLARQEDPAPMKTRIGSQLTSSAMNQGVLSDGGLAVICTPFCCSLVTSPDRTGA